MTVKVINKGFTHITGAYVIDKKTSTVYIQIPKSGSSTLRFLHEKRGFGVGDVKRLNLSNHNVCIAFIRNPYDRFLSAINEYHKRTYKDAMGIDEWLPLMVSDVQNRIKNNYTIYYDEHFVPQCHYVSLFHHVQYVERIGHE